MVYFWKLDSLGKIEVKKWRSRLSEGEIAELLTETGRKKCKCG